MGWPSPRPQVQGRALGTLLVGGTHRGRIGFGHGTGAGGKQATENFDHLRFYAVYPELEAPRDGVQIRDISLVLGIA
jgi:hypothetical protein